MLTRLAHVGVDQQRALAELREDDRQVGGEIAAPFAALGADDGQHLAFLGAVEPAQHQLAADGSDLFDARAERLVGGDEVVAELARVAWLLAQVGVGELARQRELDVRLADQPEPDGGLAEAQVLLLLVGEDALRLLLAELAAIDQDRTKGPIDARRAA